MYHLKLLRGKKHFISNIFFNRGDNSPDYNVFFHFKRCEKLLLLFQDLSPAPVENRGFWGLEFSFLDYLKLSIFRWGAI